MLRLRSALFLALVLLLPILSGCGSAAGAPPHVPFPKLRRAPHIVPPWVTSRDGRFVTSAGRPVTLHGVNVQVTSPAVYQEALRLNVNFVRIVAPWSLFEPRAPTGSVHHWSSSALAQLDREVRFFERHNINVLIDFHQFRWSPYFASNFPCRLASCLPRGIPAWYYANGRFAKSHDGIRSAEAAFWTHEARSSQAAYAAFAAMMAARYARDPNVLGYELFNEPHAGSLGLSTAATNTMLAWQSRIRKVISQVDPTRTVVVMCNGGGGGVGTANLRLLGSPNLLALDWHDYFNGHDDAGLDASGDQWVPSWTATHNQMTGTYTGTQENQKRVISWPVDRARHWRVALLIGEWGINGTVPGAADYQSQMVDLFRRAGLSNARWQLTSNGGYGLVTPAGRMSPAGVQLRAAYPAR